MASQVVATTRKKISFRVGNEDFQVQLDFKQENGELVATDSSVRFFNLLKELNLIGPSEQPDTWFKTCDGLSITYFSHPHTSLLIRKKAAWLGLRVIPGKSFETKRNLDCQKAINPQLAVR